MDQPSWCQIPCRFVMRRSRKQRRRADGERRRSLAADLCGKAQETRQNE